MVEGLSAGGWRRTGGGAPGRARAAIAEGSTNDSLPWILSGLQPFGIRPTSESVGRRGRATPGEEDEAAFAPLVPASR